MTSDTAKNGLSILYCSVLLLAAFTPASARVARLTLSGVGSGATPAATGASAAVSLADPALNGWVSSIRGTLTPALPALAVPAVLSPVVQAPASALDAVQALVDDLPSGGKTADGDQAEAVSRRAFDGFNGGGSATASPPA